MSLARKSFGVHSYQAAPTTSARQGARISSLRQLVLTAVVTFALLMLTVTVVPGQSPILPLEIGVLMFALLAWVLVHRSRAAFVTMTVFAGLLLAIAIKVLLGDACGDAVRGSWSRTSRCC
jgi:hypothetical protein